MAIDGTKLKAGVYAIPVKVGYKSVTPESVVRVEFSRDGSPPTDPTIDSRVLDHNTITSTGLFYVKARAFRQGYADSAIVSSYFLAAKASAGGQDVCGTDVLQQVQQPVQWGNWYIICFWGLVSVSMIHTRVSYVLTHAISVLNTRYDDVPPL